MTTNRAKPIAAVLTLLLAIVSLGGKARSQSVQVRGVINGRSGTTMTLQTDSGNVVVVLTGATQAQEVEGIFHARRKEMALAALVPGLAVEVQGSYYAPEPDRCGHRQIQGFRLANSYRYSGGCNSGGAAGTATTAGNRGTAGETPAATTATAGGAAGASCASSEDSREQGSHRRCKQALRRTRRLQHLG